MATDFEPIPSVVLTIPRNYPTFPVPGKLEILWDTNYHKLYHKLSPYTSVGPGVLSWGNQPFYYVFADQNNSGLNALKKYESRLFPAGSGPIDVIRVTKFLVSGAGVTFLSKQFLLQTGNAYNETRIYNPTSPIVTAGMPLVMGSVRPMRFIDLYGGLGGIAQSLIGSIGSLFGSSAINPPPGTAGRGALPDVNVSTDGKGLLRAGTANRGLSNLQSRWASSQGGASNGFFSAVAKAVTSLFSNFIPASQLNITYRSDEGAYGLMIGGGDSKFKYTGQDYREYGFGQMWIGGGTISRKKNEYPVKPYRLFVTYNSQGMRTTDIHLTTGGIFTSIPEVGNVGYSPVQSTDTNKPGYRYEDSVGVSAGEVGQGYDASDVMYQYKDYADPSQQFLTKNPDFNKDDTDTLNNTLKEVIKKLKATSGGIYSVNITNVDSKVIGTGNATIQGYNRLFATKNKMDNRSGLNYPLGVLKEYDETVVVDNTLTIDPVFNSMKLSTAGHFDALNTLNVLSGSRAIVNSKLKGWNAWNPYLDDQIALYFYDVVNDKYIPFRAAVKGIAESSNASWEELPFIGRADKIYSYGGFNRSLSLSIHIVISSIAELAPTWQRINYLATLVKPSNYTTATYQGVMNRFMIPPMVMLTLGDMYNSQPVLIQSLTTTIPEEAIWETINEDNSGQWEYLSTYITAPGLLYGQLPREVELGLGLILLEKERAIVGGANFGNAPRNEDWSAPNYNAISNRGAKQNELDQSLIVDIVNRSKPSSTTTL
jgi:hypothetical protein